MPEAIRIVNDFCDVINEGPEGFRKAVDAYFTPDTVWENVGMSITTGPEQAMGLMSNLAATGLASFKIEKLAIASEGNKVLTERVDYMIGEGGDTTLELRVMGIFEVNAEGKITRWTDYFDTGAFARQAPPT
jgi:limonene-1,2-epoxide hydrolase